MQSQGVGTSPKHFAANSQENDRTRVDERMSQRALREIYLRGFEMMVRQSQPWTIMTAYNRINDIQGQCSLKLPEYTETVSASACAPTVQLNLLRR